MQLKDLSLDELARSLDQSIARVKAAEDLELLKRDWLGKEGTLKSLLKQLRDIPDEERPKVAAKLNELKAILEKFLAEKDQAFSSSKLSKSLKEEFVDLSLPGNTPGLGGVHPVTQVERTIASILRPFGFRCVPGPEIETEYFCFDALNIPKHHPARDMQDTFYSDNGHVLRTHTTSVQARELKRGQLPVKVASFGRVYRNETEDASHQAMFHQFELVWIDEGIMLSHLLAIINHILKGIYGKRTKVRFIPKFYPYTEPSLGAQIDCGNCKGKGCSMCGGSGWLTIAGAGMVHRNVLKEFNYDPDKVSGMAFGLGSSRLAAQFGNFPHLRALYANDLRVLKGAI